MILCSKKKTKADRISYSKKFTFGEHRHTHAVIAVFNESFLVIVVKTLI